MGLLCVIFHQGKGWGCYVYVVFIGEWGGVVMCMLFLSEKGVGLLCVCYFYWRKGWGCHVYVVIFIGERGGVVVFIGERGGVVMCMLFLSEKGVGLLCVCFFSGERGGVAMFSVFIVLCVCVFHWGKG